MVMISALYRMVAELSISQSYIATMSAAELIGTIILACILMVIGVLIGTAIVMPFQGALVR